jgi:hypothetical protein
MAGVCVPEFKARGCVSVAIGVAGDAPNGVEFGKAFGAMLEPMGLLTAFFRWFLAAENIA